MDALIANTLDVPGATLYYELRGSGPVLLMLGGGPSDADIFVPIAEALSDRYTVLTCDTRGNSRSTLHGRCEDQTIELESEDAHHLLAALTQEPAFVFGNSSGALVGLELASRHAAQVRTLVAHDPPLTELLPDAADYRARSQDVYETYLRDGVGAGMMKFLSNAGLQPAPPKDGMPASPPPPEAMARMTANMQRFLGNRIRAITGYAPDLAALKSAKTRTVVAVGRESGDMLHRCTLTLAGDLGTQPVEFPGGHDGFMLHVHDFAQQLHSVFQRDASESALPSGRTAAPGRRTPTR